MEERIQSCFVVQPLLPSAVVHHVISGTCIKFWTAHPGLVCECEWSNQDAWVLKEGAPPVCGITGQYRQSSTVDFIFGTRDQLQLMVSHGAVSSLQLVHKQALYGTLTELKSIPATNV